MTRYPAEQKNVIELTLQVTRGPQQGRTIVLKRSVSLAEGNDGSIEVREYQREGSLVYIELSNPPRAYVPRDAGVRVLQNSQPFSTTVLRSEDVIRAGEMEFSVSILERQGEQDVSQARKRRKRILKVAGVASLVVLAAVATAYLYTQHQERHLEARPLVFDKNPEVWEEGNFPGFPPNLRIFLPREEAFEFRPNTLSTVTGNYLPGSTESGAIYTRHTRSLERFLELPWSELLLDAINLPQPYGRRNWTVLPPRAGNGRFLYGLSDPIFLGNYFAGLVTIQSENHLVRSDKKQERESHRVFDLELYVEVWDALPLDDSRAGIGRLSLDLPSHDDIFRSSGYSLVPKLIAQAINTTEISTHERIPGVTVQSASLHPGHPYSTARRDASRRATIHYFREGEFLVAFTAIHTDGQEFRAQPLVDEIVSRVVIDKHQYDDGDLANQARKLEAESDDLLRNILDQEGYDPKNIQWHRVQDHPHRLLKAFRLYGKAMTIYQRTDQWPHGEDFRRVYSKARILYDRIQGEDGIFPFYQEAERLITSRSYGAALHHVKAIYQYAQNAQDPHRFIEDEWFLYARSRREFLIDNQ